MQLKLRITLLFAVILYFIMLFKLLKEKRLNLKYTLLWILLGIIMCTLVLYPNILLVFTTIIGIIDPINGLFAIVNFCVLIILMSITAIVSKLNEKNKKLVQNVGILEKRVRELEALHEDKTFIDEVRLQ